MKVLLGTCVWGGVRQALSDAGHDVVWTGDWDEDPGDDEILTVAYRENRVLAAPTMVWLPDGVPICRNRANELRCAHNVVPSAT